MVHTDRPAAAPAIILLLALALVLPTMPLAATGQVSAVVLLNVELVTVAEDSAEVTWMTNLASDTRVQWGSTTDLGEEDIVEEENNYHVGTMVGLYPGTTYHYRVGSGGTWTDISSFTTLDPPGGGFRLQFAIIADPHIDEDGTNSANGAMYAEGPRLLSSAVDEVNADPNNAFVMVTGDISHSLEEDLVMAVGSLDRLRVPWHHVLGNWDKREEGWEGVWTSVTGRTDLYYSFDAGGYHIVVLDSAVQGQTGGGLDEAQLEWFESDLDAHDAIPTLVFIHHPSDTTDEIFGIDAASKAALDDILMSRPWVFSLTAGHNHMNTVHMVGERVYITTASTIQFPIGYTTVRLYGEGFTQAFHKVEAELETSEESRIRIDASGGDPDADDEYLGDLGDRSAVVRVPVNDPPVMEGVSVSPGTVGPGEVATVTVQATDPDGDALTFEYVVTGGTIVGTGPSVSWTAPMDEGTYTVMVTASDGSLTASGQASLKVEEEEGPPPDDNRPPEVVSLSLGATLIETGGETGVTVDAWDPDDDVLTYEYTVTGGEVVGSGPEVNYRAPTKAGTYEISVRVLDGELASDWRSKDITVYSPPPPANEPPVIDDVTVSAERIGPGEAVTIEVKASDPDGDDIDYIYESGSGDLSGTGKRVTWTAPSYEGLFSIDVHVSDGDLDSKRRTVYVTVVAPKDDGGDGNVPGFGAWAVLVALALLAAGLRGRSPVHRHR